MKDVNGKDRPCIKCKWHRLINRKAEDVNYYICQWRNIKVQPNETCTMFERHRPKVIE